MIYAKSITIPANTPVAAPLKTRWHVVKGLVYQVEIYFPPGSSGLAGTWIEEAGFQVWPFDPGESFFGDNTLISFTDRYWVANEGRVLDVFCYNTDDSYEHRIQVRLGIESNPTLLSSYIPGLAFDKLESSIAELIASQEQARIEGLHELAVKLQGQSIG